MPLRQSFLHILVLFYLWNVGWCARIPSGPLPMKWLVSSGIFFSRPRDVDSLEVLYMSILNL